MQARFGMRRRGSIRPRKVVREWLIARPNPEQERAVADTVTVTPNRRAPPAEAHARLEARLSGDFLLLVGEVGCRQPFESHPELGAFV